MLSWSLQDWAPLWDIMDPLPGIRRGFHLEIVIVKYLEMLLSGFYVIRWLLMHNLDSWRCLLLNYISLCLRLRSCFITMRGRVQISNHKIVMEGLLTDDWGWMIFLAKVLVHLLGLYSSYLKVRLWWGILKNYFSIYNGKISRLWRSHMNWIMLRSLTVLFLDFLNFLICIIWALAACSLKEWASLTLIQSELLRVSSRDHWWVLLLPWLKDSILLDILNKSTHISWRWLVFMVLNCLWVDD